MRGDGSRFQAGGANDDGLFGCVQDAKMNSERAERQAYQDKNKKRKKIEMEKKWRPPPPYYVVVLVSACLPTSCTTSSLHRSRGTHHLSSLTCCFVRSLTLATEGDGYFYFHIKHIDDIPVYPVSHLSVSTFFQRQKKKRRESGKKKSTVERGERRLGSWQGSPCL